MKERPLAGVCYDHLGGVLGERLARRLVDLGWVTHEPNPGVTPLGWAGLLELGIDPAPLLGSRRRPVSFCLERQGGQQYDHVGAHLGALLLQHFVKSGWLQASGEQYELTSAGEQALRRLGVAMEEPT